MKSIKVISVGIMAVLLMAQIFAAVLYEPGIRVRTLSERVKIFNIDTEYVKNITALKTEKGIVVIDTDVSPSFARLIRKRIEKEFGRSDFLYVINTHAHGDHTWGNQIFKDAEIIGHKNCREEMAGFSEEAKADAERYGRYVDSLKLRLEKADTDSQEAIDLKKNINEYSLFIQGIKEGFESCPPTITFTDRLHINLGDINLDLIYFGAAHSRSDILIHCPEEGLLITGDLFIPQMIPSWFKTSQIDQLPRWIESLEEMTNGQRAINHIITGHDDTLKPEDLKKMLRYFQNERERIAGKTSAYPLFTKMLEESNPEKALESLQKTARDGKTFYLLESDFISQGNFWIYREKKYREAIELFKIMAELFPESWNVFDCLGEAYAAGEQPDQAIKSFKKSLELNPDNSHAQRQIELLTEKKK